MLGRAADAAEYAALLASAFVVPVVLLVAGCPAPSGLRGPLLPPCCCRCRSRAPLLRTVRTFVGAAAAQPRAQGNGAAGARLRRSCSRPGSRSAARLWRDRRVPERSLRADRVSVPFRRPFPTATGMWVEREAWILRLVDADGRVGLGRGGGRARRRRGRRDDARRRWSARRSTSAAGAGCRRWRRPGDARAPGRALRRRSRARGSTSMASVRGASRRRRRRRQRDAPVARSGGGRPRRRSSRSIGVRDAQAQGRRRARDRGAGRPRPRDPGGGRADVRLRLDVNGAWDLATAEDRLEAVAPVRHRVRRAAARRARHRWRWPSSPARPRPDRGRRGGRVRARRPRAARRPMRSTSSSSSRPASGAGRGARRSPSSRRSEACPSSSARCSRPGSGSRLRWRWRRRCPRSTVSPLADPLDHGLATAGLLEHDLLAGSLIVEDGRMRAPGGAGAGRAGGRPGSSGARAVRGSRVAAVTAPMARGRAVAARAATSDLARDLAVVDGDPLDLGRAGPAVPTRSRVGLRRRASRRATASRSMRRPSRRGRGRGPRDRSGRGRRGAVAGRAHGARAAAAAVGRGPRATGRRSLVPARSDSSRSPATRAAVDPTAPAVVVLTSGTTGRPKAAVLSRRPSSRAPSLARPRCRRRPAGCSRSGSATSRASASCGGRRWRGVPLVVLDRPGPGRASWPRSRGSRRPATSRSSRRCSPASSTRPATDRRRPTLRAVPLGGGTHPPGARRRALEAGWPVVPTYGLTEAGSGVRRSRPTRRPPSGECRPGAPGVELRIVEPDAGRGRRDRGPERRPCSTRLPSARPPRRLAADRRPRKPRRRRPPDRRRSPDRPDRARRREHRAIRGRGRAARPPGHRRCSRRRATRRDLGSGAGRGDRAPTRCRRPGRRRDLRVLPRTLARFKVPGRVRPARGTAADSRRQAPRRGASGRSSTATPRAIARSTRRRRHRLRVDRRRARSTPSPPRHAVDRGPARPASPRALAAPGDATVHAVDRRGSGRAGSPTRARSMSPSTSTTSSRSSTPRGIGGRLVGVSYGGVVALEFAARRPGPRPRRRRLRAAVRTGRRSPRRRRLRDRRRRHGAAASRPAAPPAPPKRS